MDGKFGSRDEARDYMFGKFEEVNRAFDRKSVIESTRLNDAGLDSLDLNAALLALEEDRGLRFSDEELDQLETFGQLVDSMLAKQGV